jgi:hypothetical protein
MLFALVKHGIEKNPRVGIVDLGISGDLGFLWSQVFKTKEILFIIAFGRINT